MTYATRDDIEQLFGAANVAKWADLDNNGDGALIAARVERAILWSAAEIDDRLRGGQYALPLTVNSGGVLPLTVVDIAAALAGVWLYESRGVQDFNEETGQPVHRLMFHRKRVETTIADIRAGKRTIDCERASPSAATAPFVVIT